VLSEDASESKGLCILAATVASKADPTTSRTITKKIFESFMLDGERQIGVFLQMVGELNEVYFQKWIVEEYVKYIHC
jgi:hypothetical protein